MNIWDNVVYYTASYLSGKKRGLGNEQTCH